MAITYDEVWISTMREINICKDYIRSYEKKIRSLEKELGIKVSQLNENMFKDKKIKKLYETKLALEREQKRLKELEEFLK